MYQSSVTKLALVLALCAFVQAAPLMQLPIHTQGSRNGGRCGSPMYWNPMHGNSFPIGTEVKFWCGMDLSYKLHGSSVITCLSSGGWSNPNGAYCSNQNGRTKFLPHIVGASTTNGEALTIKVCACAGYSRSIPTMPPSWPQYMTEPPEEPPRTPHGIFHYLLHKRLGGSDILTDWFLGRMGYE